MAGPGEVLLLTGASGAVGQAAARLMHEKGFTLALQGRREEDLKKLADQLGAPAPVILVGDPATPEGADAIIKETIRAFGRLDVLVSTIGGIDPAWPRLSKTSDEALLRMLDLNLMAPFRLARAAAGVMKEGGRIVLTASRGGLAPNASGGAYAIAKAALVAAVQVLAGDLKDDGVRVNAVAPGTILTEANRRDMPDADQSRWVTPEEVANALYFLASRESSGVTGAVLPVYGRT